MKFPRIIVARYNSTCPRCFKKIYKGSDLITKMKDARHIIGEDCEGDIDAFVHLHCSDIKITITVK